METKQTAVQFLIEHIKQDTFVHCKSTKEWNQVFAQAKAIEKNKMLEFWKGGQDSMEEGGKSFEQYYNEIYGK
jgi:hypothetical protein